MSRVREQSQYFDHAAIRRAVASDIDAVYAIAAAGKLESWSRGSYVNYTRRENAVFLVAETDKICGFVVAGVFPAAREAEIHNIAVAPEYRRRGIASQLLREISKFLAAGKIENLFLEVRESNIPAIKTYEKCGFEIIGRRPDFYADPPEDAFIMRKSLTCKTL
ncbi:MAG: ribosomal protein S18-alanine N-acetyltransferase [Acidobacteriota bacterium]|jgi:ribosomal-protein-alanine N-acetyltransferase